MADERVQRRLAAILVADVVGYSRLMEQDEAGTRARLRSLHAEVIDPRIAADGGRIVKTSGDGILVEFGSVVDAVGNALAIQTAMSGRNDVLPEDRRIMFRVGINVGDVIVEGNDIHGDGVNVAARLEGLCEPGEVFVSGTVYDQAAGKLAASFDDLGEQTVKNIAKPVRIYRVRAEWREVDVPQNQIALDTRPSPPDKPSIAVLPFNNMSGDPEQEYFSDGMTEDLITDLSKVSGLFVIARNSSFAYKGKSPDLRQLGREFGVRHVLEGSVRKAGNRVRINAQLIDAETGGHLWAERYDGELDDIFVLQDEITTEIVSALKLGLMDGGQQRKERRPTENMEAYDLFLQARGATHRPDRKAFALAAELLERAIGLDPNFAEAHAILSRVQMFDSFFMWRDDASLSRAVETARHAVALDDTSVLAHVYLGWISIFDRSFDNGIAELERAIALDPNFADGYFFLAEALNYMGKPEKSLEVSRTALRLNPLLHGIHIGHSNYLLGNYEDAVVALKDATERLRHPIGFLLLAATHMEIGQIEDAKVVVRNMLQIVPDYTVRFVEQLLPYQNEDTRNRYTDSLRKAGLPE